MTEPLAQVQLLTCCMLQICTGDTMTCMDAVGSGTWHCPWQLFPPPPAL
jgi:hypothetical protein